ncbi:helix-turn-helix domain-containing protein [Streptomyces sp. NPDC090741]|uniref:helix-turn-helix domain-containing protein n=1 Tax=Streptomyces sp. NPDC090741 TaxID=3365967 RepID=UPI003802CE38
MHDDQQEALRWLGLRIQDARRAARLTQEQVYLQADIPRNTYQRIEYGQTDPRFSHLVRIARIVRVPVRDLMP